MNKLVPTDAILIPDTAERVFQGIIYDVYQWQQQLFGESATTFEMLKRPDTTVAICIVDDKILVLSDEQPHRGVKLTFPGGRVDSTDPSILASMQREVHEETGYEFEQWRLVSVVQPQTKIEWFVHYFVAAGVKSQAAPHVDEGEKIVVEQHDLVEVKQFVAEKSGFLGQSLHIFDQVKTLEDLAQLPAFTGQEVDR